MKNTVTAGAAASLAAAVVSVALVLAPAASAAAATGPDTVGCAQANAAVLTAALKANRLAALVQAGQDQVIVALKAKVVTAQTAYDTAYAAFQHTPNAATLAVLVAAQGDLKAALDELGNAPGVPADEKTALDAATAEVQVAINLRITACAPPIVEVTPTPAPTTTVAPTTTEAPIIPVTTDPVTVRRIPNAIDTGHEA